RPAGVAGDKPIAGLIVFFKGAQPRVVPHPVADVGIAGSRGVVMAGSPARFAARPDIDRMLK
ncbi:MAG TPA: hypothetical protein PLP20_02075, partial [Oscillospiraceae bacterium]|nr:hypothetical protein [Oscillospiraceae bacterium]